jgi:hypothetical protein
MPPSLHQDRVPVVGGYACMCCRISASTPAGNGDERPFMYRAGMGDAELQARKKKGSIMHGETPHSRSGHGEKRVKIDRT